MTHATESWAGNSSASEKPLPLLARTFRYSPADAWLLLIALVHGGLSAGGVFALRTASSSSQLALAALFMATGMWWSSNTVSHNHLHNPIFRSRGANRALSLYLSVLLLVPQTLWRTRHLAHHAGMGGNAQRERALGRRTQLEIGACLLCFGVLCTWAPRLMLLGVAPGYLIGLGLCWLQGHYEHAAGGEAGVSHYSWLYNRLWLNDGFHVEHHRFPREHWTRLPTRRVAAANTSFFPPVLRWLASAAGAANRLQGAALCRLERLALRSPHLQTWLISVHARALSVLWPQVGAVSRVAVVGGGLFPRTALALRQVAPACSLVLIDTSASNLARAEAYLAGVGALHDVELRHAHFDAGCAEAFDLVVLPLAFLGEKQALLCGSARTWLVHDWLWRVRGPRSVVISLWLLKRLNLVHA
jgi:hypothetical protein